jgi:hypothetical protein
VTSDARGKPGGRTWHRSVETWRSVQSLVWAVGRGEPYLVGHWPEKHAPEKMWNGRVTSAKGGWIHESLRFSFLKSLHAARFADISRHAMASTTGTQ